MKLSFAALVLSGSALQHVSSFSPNGFLHRVDSRGVGAGTSTMLGIFKIRPDPTKTEQQQQQEVEAASSSAGGLKSFFGKLTQGNEEGTSNLETANTLTENVNENDDNRPVMEKIQTMIETELAKNQRPDFDEGFLNFMAEKKMDENGSSNNPQQLGNGQTLTERMLSKVPTEFQASGAGGFSTLDAFQRAEANWSKIKAFEPFEYDPKLLQREQNGQPAPRQFVTSDGGVGNPKCWSKLQELSDEEKDVDYDVVVCGGTLGIFFATYLQMRGYSVCVLEAGKLRGREQEWNISMNELIELLELNILTQEDIDAVITTEFPACRSGFKNQEVTPLSGGYFDNQVGYECLTPDVLNLGVAPSMLLERVAKRFVDVGGTIKDETRLQGVCVSELVGSAIDLGEDQEPITSRLVLDCMGNGSPISAQQRYGMKPDGICAVVGSCAGGFDATSNKVGDIIYTNTPIIERPGKGANQYFWEAFPVGIGRNGKESSDVKTTYMFTYMDANEDRPSLLDLMEDYWKLLPRYQPSINNPETDLDIKRILFAYFPTYRDSPLKPNYSRILAVGDASGIQSPLSFGGFGALTRHLDRVGGAICEALDNNCLHRDDLGEINAYQPNLSAAWMFQKAMSVRMDQKNVDLTFVNRLLATNFQVMDKMGEKTMKPFLQDVVRFDGLVGSLAKSFVADPLFMPQIVLTVGLPELIEWLGHVGTVSFISFIISFPILLLSIKFLFLLYSLNVLLFFW